MATSEDVDLPIGKKFAFERRPCYWAPMNWIIGFAASRMALPRGGVGHYGGATFGGALPEAGLQAPESPRAD